MKQEFAIFAGGCFWGMEELFRKQPGVLDLQVGYCGGNIENPNYELVKTGQTGHAESIKIEFDAQKTSYQELLLFFFRVHDPTTLNQQGGDLGSQYRSAIFYMNEEQRQTALAVMKRVEQSGVWKKPLTTELTAFQKWWDAEDFHQDYLQKFPDGYTCHFVRKMNF